MSREIGFFCCSLVIGVALVAATSAQSGGPFVITESVVTGGGVSSSNGNTSVGSTSGQPAAGGSMRSGPFVVTSGFWNFSPLAPTAATTSVGGRILTSDGLGIRNAVVTLTSQNGAPRIVLSGSFGYYNFDDVAVGQSYVVAVSAKRYSFSQPALVVSVVDQLVNVNFIAEP